MLPTIRRTSCRARRRESDRDENETGGENMQRENGITPDRIVYDVPSVEQKEHIEKSISAKFELDRTAGSA